MLTRISLAAASVAVLCSCAPSDAAPGTPTTPIHVGPAAIAAHTQKPKVAADGAKVVLLKDSNGQTWCSIVDDNCSVSNSLRTGPTYIQVATVTGSDITTTDTSDGSTQVAVLSPGHKVKDGDIIPTSWVAR